MPWGPRVAETSPTLAEGDKQYIFGVYNDVSGNLTGFMPVYKDLSDSAEYDSLVSTTALTAGLLIGKATAGRVVLGNNYLANGGGAGASAGTSAPFVGVYSPTNPNDRPSTGDVIRITKFGVTPVQISAGQSPNVGDYLLSDSLQPLALTRGRLAAAGRPSQGQQLGYVTATTGAISIGQAVAPLNTFGFGFLVNGWVDPR